jgi:hypothetical protein
VKITQRELVRRINQKLDKNIEEVMESRDGESNNETDEYYTIEFDQNKITTTNVDIEKLGKELGVLKDFEKLED